jgi:hypothetical protein
LNEGDVEDLVRYRDEHELKNVKDLNQVIKISTAQAGNMANLVKVSSMFFTVRSTCSLGKVVHTAEAVLRRDGGSIITTSWREF